MAETAKKLVIVGAGEFAEIAFEYFTHDSPHEVVAFAVEREFLDKETLFDLPVCPLDEMEQRYPSTEHQAFVAVTFTKLNRVRARLYHEVRQKGYQLASYVSSRAFVWHNVKMGENCFVFENNVIQYHCEIGNNVVLWSGNHIGHRSVIGDHCFLSSHVVISGYCDVGESCFFGVNSAVGNNVKIAQDCVIAAGSMILRDTEPGKVYKSEAKTRASISSFRLFNLEEVRDEVA